MPCRLSCLACVLTLGALAAAAETPPPIASRLCLDAAEAAAARHSIPVEMMRAITLVETRRTVNGATGPWPWTLNIGGKGYWHETQAGALAHAEREMAEGRRSIDLGCFQLNYRWHGAAFSGPNAMLEPMLAADYAAAFLASLYAETGDWMRAAGLYHSRTPDHATRYRGLVRRAMARSGTSPERLAVADPGPQWPAPAGPVRHAVVSASPKRSAAPKALPGAVVLAMFASPGRPLLVASAVRP